MSLAEQARINTFVCQWDLTSTSESKTQSITNLQDWPAHYDPEGNTPRGFQQQVEKQEDQHMHAKVQNSDIYSPLQIQFQNKVSFQVGYT